MREAFLIFLMLGILASLAVNTSHAAKIFLVNGGYPGSSSDLHTKIRDGINITDYDVIEASPLDLSTKLDNEHSRRSVLVLSDARYLPAEAKRSLLSFLKRGNHLLAISGPVFEELVVWQDDKWLTRSQAKEKLAETESISIIDFGHEDISKWNRYSGTISNKTTHTVKPSGDPNISCKVLHGIIDRLDDWETFVSPSLQESFPPKYSTTVFWAKGGPETPELIVEWREKDGSRWMAVVTLTTGWRRYALTPEDFRFWGDGSPTGRGKPSDSFNPSNADAISFGIANGISHQKMNISHEFWIADMRAAKDPNKDVDFNPPMLESLSPTYKTHNTMAAQLKLLPWNETLPIQTSVIAAIPRSPAICSDAIRKWRLIPVVDALGKHGESLGYAAHMFLNTTGDYSGSIWGYIGLDQSFLTAHSDRASKIVTYMLEKMCGGVFLANAGTEHIAYKIDEPINYGAYLANFGVRKVDYVDTMFQVFKDGDILASDSIRTELEPHSGPVYIDGTSAIQGQVDLQPGLYTIKVWTMVRGKIVDEIDHEFRILKHEPVTEKNTVIAKDGDFYLDGRKWYPLGVNYWPRYATGLEQNDYWLHWLSPEQYNPEIIEQDLALAHKLGINLVSIQYGKTNQSRPLMDFMDRAEQHGIKVHMYMPGLHPLYQDFELANSLISLAHLAQTPALFSYDVGWEVHVGKYERRKAYDGIWQDWVSERYGSVESAEKDWNYKPDRVNGFITGPSDEQLMKDGPWRVYVAAYRRFWDDEISKRYMAVRSNIRAVDPRHLIGARSGYGGTGSSWVVPDFAFDLKSGIKHLDYSSPEAYGLGGDKAGFLKGGLNTIYGRFVGDGKPVFWAEYGMSIWPLCDTVVLEEARKYYESILEMIYLSGANGSAAWWWPGGFRVGENSDFGIINPDGTPRPAALEIQKAAAKLTTPRDHPQPDYFLTIDRDKYVSGYSGIFSAHYQEYVDAVLSGKSPGLQTHGTGTTSADTPLVAVGNVPCNGNNPPKYLNAEFNYVKINGNLVSDRETVIVQKGKPVVVEVSVGNTGDAKWIPRQEMDKGAVALVMTVNSNNTEGTSNALINSNTKVLHIFLETEVPYLSDVKFTKVEIPEGAEYLSMRMTAFDRVDFGEVFEVRLECK